MAVIVVRDIDGMSYVTFDGEFVEKLPTKNDSVVRRHVSDYVDVTVDHRPAKKKMFGGEKPELWYAQIRCGMFISLTVDAAQKPQLDRLVAALDATKTT